MQKSDALVVLKRSYVVGVRQAGKGLARMGIASGAPPDRHRHVAHWLYSLTRVHDSLQLAEIDVPWWTYRAIEVVDTWLATRPRPVRVFEYGSGASTVWLAKRADVVRSVEHHRGFAELIGPTLTALGNVTLSIVEPRHAKHPVVPSAKEGCESLDFADYVAAIGSVDGEFDLIVIDGRARQACLEAAQPRLARGGLIVFDNSRRRRYRSAITGSGLEERVLRGLVPTLPYPDQTSLLTRTTIDRS